jgi:hypothetical protein
MFRMTVSSFSYDERKHQLTEYEMHFKISKRARRRADINHIRKQLEEKGRGHFHYWLLKHRKVQLDREVRVNFEHEERAKKQIVQTHASVRRFLMRRLNRRWEAEELPSGKIRFAKRRRKHGRA